MSVTDTPRVATTPTSTVTAVAMKAVATMVVTTTTRAMQQSTFSFWRCWPQERAPGHACKERGDEWEAKGKALTGGASQPRPSQWRRHPSWTTAATKSPAVVQPDDPIVLGGSAILPATVTAPNTRLPRGA
jgi:hypothetical protein